MSALRLPSTAGTSPHLHVKAADDGHPHDVLLVLRLGVLQNDRAGTVSAARGKRHVDLLIHPAGNRSCRSRSVARTRLVPAAWGYSWVLPWRTVRHFACWPAALPPVACAVARSPPVRAPTASPMIPLAVRIPPSPGPRSLRDWALASI